MKELFLIKKQSEELKIVKSKTNRKQKPKIMKYYLDVLKNFAKFDGRARRKEYWMFVLFNMIFMYSLMFIGIYLKFPLLSTIYMLAVLVPSIAVGVRRMHDVGKSGWYLLIPIYSLILACTNGEEGRNQYGEDPKGNFNEINEIGQPQE